MFHRLSKHLEFCQKYSTARRIFNSLLGVWISRWNSVARVWCITYKLGPKARVACCMWYTTDANVVNGLWNGIFHAQFFFVSFYKALICFSVCKLGSIFTRNISSHEFTQACTTPKHCVCCGDGYHFALLHKVLCVARCYLGLTWLFFCCVQFACNVYLAFFVYYSLFTDYNIFVQVCQIFGQCKVKTLWPWYQIWTRSEYLQEARVCWALCSKNFFVVTSKVVEIKFEIWRSLKTSLAKGHRLT